ncbi:hypothetical protein MaudMau93_004046 [Microsporum audouinii]
MANLNASDSQSIIASVLVIRAISIATRRGADPVIGDFGFEERLAKTVFPLHAVRGPPDDARDAAPVTCIEQTDGRKTQKDGDTPVYPRRSVDFTVRFPA